MGDSRVKQTAKALDAFFYSFGIDSYAESEVPDDAKPPYITYELIDPDWMGKAPLHARVWYRSNNLIAISEKVDEIKAALGNGGVSIKTESGAVYLWPDDNFAQIQPFEGDPTLKCAFLSLIIQAITN